MSYLHESKSSDLDFFRWLAAFMVLVGHSRAFFLGYAGNLGQGTDPLSLTLKVLFFLTGFPAEAVIIFFVLSGYLVGGSSYIRAMQSSFSLRTYALDRFSRIYIVLIPALILGFILDFIGVHFINYSGIYSNGPVFKAMTEVDFDQRLSIVDFVGSIFHLENIITKSFGSNSPLWSLALEWWYYFIWGFICWTIEKPKIGRVALTAGAVVGIFLLFPLKGSLYFLLWLVGVVSAIVPKPKFNWKIVAVIVFLATLLYSRIKRGGSDYISLYDVYFKDCLISAAFGFLLWVRRYSSYTFSSIHQQLSAFSFSLYITHYPFVVFFAALLYHFAGVSYLNGVTLINVSAYVFSIFASLLLAKIFAYFTEDRTGDFRILIRRLKYLK